MDPFIEAQAWPDFHVSLVAELRNALVPEVRPHYIVRVERRVYVEHEPDEPRSIRPDALVAGDVAGPRAPTPRAVPEGAPLLLTLPMPEERREPFLTIREPESLDVVTVIELLSPSNKRRGGEGRRQYLAKREAILVSETHLVELDLLRGGERMPTRESPPDADFFAFVCRADCRPRAEVWPVGIRHRLPEIPIPLREGDADVPLDLQTVFEAVYDRAGYDYSIDHSRPLDPPLRPGDEEWLAGLLAGE
jgi:hypothetical protein